MAKMSDSLAAFADQLKYLEMGSAVFRAEEKEALRKLFPNTRLCMHYGLTEASRSTFLEFKAVPPVGSSSSDQPLGLIYIRAPTVMLGYWHDEKQTVAALNRETGWLNSGDLGWVDEAGYVYLAGRADEAINCGGAKFLPDELERYAEEFDSVMECGCIGVPDPAGVLGDVPLLCVTGNGTIDPTGLAKHIRKRFSYDLPSVIVRIVESLPRTESGKLIRRELATLAEKR